MTQPPDEPRTKEQEGWLLGTGCGLAFIFIGTFLHLAPSSCLRGGPRADRKPKATLVRPAALLYDPGIVAWKVRAPKSPLWSALLRLSSLRLPACPIFRGCNAFKFAFTFHAHTFSTAETKAERGLHLSSWANYFSHQQLHGIQIHPKPSTNAHLTTQELRTKLLVQPVHFFNYVRLRVGFLART